MEEHAAAAGNCFRQRHKLSRSHTFDRKKQQARAQLSFFPKGQKSADRLWLNDQNCGGWLIYEA